ncbi:MAG TPA: transporter substrate-binding domain-containing protein [Solirubrobacteraceae bacterium]|nr:transporter substrate-binding domain-containing protein [Solirubrobacteraceae bacterium]
MNLRIPSLACVAAVGGLLLTGCGSPKKTASAPVKATANACTPAKLATHTKGVLTVATDSPAYPPYFEHNNPKNGEGLESAVAYAVAKKLGYAQDRVKWVVEPFDSSYAPGPKSFDFDINEISITPARSKVVTFSTPYYTNPQGILVKANSPLAHAKSLAAFKHAKIGVQIGTTSLAAVTAGIKPSQQPDVFNTSNDVVNAFKIGRVNAIVVDLATGFELTSEIKGSTIAGQFSAAGGDHWGLLMAKGDPIASCVNRAVGALRADGTLAALSKRWISSAAKVPVLH